MQKKEYFKQKTERQSQAVDADILKQQHPSMPVHQKRSSSTTTGKKKPNLVKNKILL